MNVCFSLEEIKTLNSVQTEILRETARVCKLLGIRFFMVHGSLLGTIRNEAFVPYDDDIDIAMHRRDYDIFLAKAPALIDKKYFVQSVLSDPNYPMAFSKVRDSDTTYIVESVEGVKMHHGVYIDIFPIDRFEESRLATFARKLMAARISCVFRKKPCKLRSKIIRLVSCFCFPSYRLTLLMRERLIKSGRSSEYVCMTGGKSSETKIPAKWFSSFEERRFEGVDVYIPAEYDVYLKWIYGDYNERTLVEDKMKADKVQLNAVAVDLARPYSDYMEK